MENTKIFYGDVFLDKEKLDEINIKYPIELEYYKTCSRKNDLLKENEIIYGVEIIKKEYIGQNIHTEKAFVDNITKDEKELNSVIFKLKENTVTPITLNDVINDLFYKG